MGDIGPADILLVAAVIGKPNAIATPMLQKARRPPTMLDVGPAVRRRARHKEAVARGYKRQFVRAKHIRT